MYTAKPATKEIKGWIDITIDQKPENAIELAAAWGLMFRPKRGECHWVEGNTVIFRVMQSTFNDWIDIVNSVTEKK